MEALKRLERITPKYNLSNEHPQDNLSLIQCREEQNKNAKRMNRKITFDPSITSKMNLADCFQNFTQEDTSMTPAERQPPARGITLIHIHINIYTDGSCTDNGKANMPCGARIWFRRNSRKNESVKVKGTNLTNQVGELATIIRALEIAPNYIPLTIKTDLKYAIDGLTSHLKKWEDIGWIGIKNQEWIK
jgi:hypothetical protein